MGLRERVGYWLLRGKPVVQNVTFTSSPNISYSDSGSSEDEMGKASKRKKAGKAKAAAKVAQKQKAAAKKGK